MEGCPAHILLFTYWLAKYNQHEFYSREPLRIQAKTETWINTEHCVNERLSCKCLAYYLVKSLFGVTCRITAANLRTQQSEMRLFLNIF